MKPLTSRLAALASALLLAQTALAADPPALTSGVDLASFDPAVRPQDDFFRSVNGGWLKRTEFPADKAYIGSFDVIHEKIQGELRTLVEAAATAPKDADARRIGVLYTSFMDEAAVEKAGLAPLADELAAIDKIATPGEVAAAMGHLSTLALGMPVDVEVGQDARRAERYVPQISQGGLGLPDRDYFLVADDAKFKVARQQYVVYMARLLQLSRAPGDATASAEGVLALETALAKARWTQVENRDPVKTYNRVDLAGLAPLAPGFDWPAWLAATGVAGKSGDVIVAQPSYLAGMAAQLSATPLPVWRAYLRVRLLDGYARYLGKDFVDARFAFVGATLSGTTDNLPRWKRGIGLVEGSVGESLGKLYVDAYFPPESKRRMEKLVANLLATYRESIDAIDWMSPATKKEAQAKLATFAPKIGYPKRWLDYSAITFQGNYHTLHGN